MNELSAVKFLSKLRALDVVVTLQGERLRCNAPAGVMTPELRDELAARKVELLNLLQDAPAGNWFESKRITHVPREDKLPLSFAQQRLWFLGQMKGISEAYHIPLRLYLKGSLDRAVLRRALDRILARHEALRTTFSASDGEPVQRIAAAENSKFLLIEHDISLAKDPLAEIGRLIELETDTPFDFEAGPLIRGRLIQFSNEEHVLLITMHHIVSDGWSLALVNKELSALYTAFLRGQNDPLPNFDIQYADYSLWQRRAIEGDLLKQQTEYWKTALAGAPTLLDVPADHPRPAVQDYKGAFELLALDEQLTARLKEFSSRHQVTLFMTLMAAWAALLARLSGQQDVLIGTPVANREQKEIQELIGFFVNTVAVRLDFSGSPSVTDVIEQVRVQTFAALKNQDIPFDKVVELTHPVRTLAHAPVVQVMFAWQNTIQEKLKLPGIEVQTVPSPGMKAKVDLLLDLQETDGTICGCIEYAASLFEQSTILRYAGYLRKLLQGMVADDSAAIDGLPIIPEDERRQLLYDWNTTKTGFLRHKCVHQLFEEQAARTPEATALSFEGHFLSYSELNRRANQLAHYLRELGVKPDDRVAICTERGLEMMVALLAILKAGAAYVPFDPAYPPERLHFMLQDSAPIALLIQDDLRGHFEGVESGAPFINMSDAASWSRFPETNPEPKLIGLEPQHLAYVIYTSGSTGNPKGVLVEHQNVVRLFSATDEWFHFDRHDVWTLFHSYAFDFSVWEIWGALLYGGRLVIVPKAVARSSSDFYRLLCHEKVTVLNQTPSAFRQLIAAQATSGESHCLRYIVFGGEALEVATLKPWYEQNRGKQTQLINMYGITETTVHVTYRPLNQVDVQHRGASPIGAAIPDLTTYILDPYGEPVPIGVTGELYVGGAGVARGYLNRPELTAARFLPDPFSFDSGTRMYRTGDLGRWLPDGTIEYLGRNDFQVKIRGFRIELGEIETRLSEFPDVGEAVVIAREETPGDNRLVAYYTTPSIAGANQNTISAERLRSHLLETLPEYMVPAAYVHMQSLPLNNNGKLDRKALPAPEIDSYSTRDYEPPRNEMEIKLAAIWADLLKLDRVGRRDNFFELGGHSLLAITLIERMRASGFNTDVRALFSSPTLAELTANDDCRVPAIEIPANRIPSGCKVILPGMLPLIELTPKEIEKVVSTVPGGAENVQDIYPLVHLQDGILYHHLMGGEGDAYLVSAELSFENRELLDNYLAALQWVVDRNDILRTAVVWEGLPEPAQVVWRNAPLRVEEIVLDPSSGDIADQLYTRFDPRHFRIDVRTAPLTRVYLAEDPKNGRWLVMQLLHHLAIDHTSMEIMQSEIQAHMLGKADQLPTPFPFRNLVALARLGLGNQEHESFFRKMLADVDEPTAPFALLDMQGGGSGIEEASRALDDGFARLLRNLARRMGVSAASIWHVAWAQVLAKTSDRKVVTFGTVIFGRMQGNEGSDRAMGPFINTLPLRLSIGEESVEATVKRAHALLVDLMQHEHASLALAQRCSAVRAPLPLFTSLLNYRYQTALDPQQAAQAWQGIRQFRVEERTDYPLYLAVDDMGEGFAITAQTLSSIGAKRICEFMQTAIESLVDALESSPAAEVGSLDVLPAAESNRALNTWNDTKADYPAEVALAKLVENQVERTPDAIAVAHGDQRLTYRELNSLANQLASELRSHGAGPEQLVGLCVGRSTDLVVALLAIVKSGAAYMPLDPMFPPDRLAYMLEDSGAQLLVTEESLRGLLPPFTGTTILLQDEAWRANSSQNSAVAVAPENLAYLIYTSGSTGRPKGVQVPRGALVNFLWSMREWLQLSERDRLLAVTTISFDIAGLEIWLPLLVGAQTIVASREDAADGDALRALIERHDIKFLQATPVTWWLLLGAGWHGKPDMQVVCGGEAMPPELAAQLVPLVKRLWNLYGPTETTIWSTGYLVEDGAAPVLIGRPIGNTQCFILDRQRRPAPVGSVGELYIAGDGLARGYLNRPELTAEKFVPNPFNTEQGARMYRTGDLARYLPDGNIQCLGRTDHQVKIRGFRIELGEIETVLKQHAGIHRAIVVARGATPAEKKLVAYFIPANQQIPVGLELRAFLRQNLPDYMVPSDYVALETFPISPSGKIDIKALPDPSASSSGADISAELAPIESMLREYPKFAAVAMILPPNAAPDTRPVVFAIPKGSEEPPAIMLRKHLRGRCPERLIPEKIVYLRELPTNENGAVDRFRLIEMHWGADAASGATYKVSDAPQTESEIKIAAVWREILKIPRIGVNDKFFDLGGHSLLSIQMIARVEAETGYRFILRDVLMNTLGQLAQTLSEALKTGVGV